MQNKVFLIGRLTKDPAIFQTNNGIKYSRFTLAVHANRQLNKTNFVPLIAWRNNAEFLEKYLKKGALISVEGSVNVSSYVNNENKIISKVEVLVENLKSLQFKNQMEKELETEDKEEDQMFETQINSNKEEVEQSDEETEVDDIPWDNDL